MATEIKPKVLLIDDEKFLLELYSIKFLKNGFDVFSCTSAEEGLNILRRGYEPEAILFDITMPETNGYEFLEGLRDIHFSKKPLTVALTNEGQVGEKQRTAELGVDAHLIKAQFTAGEVVEKVQALLATDT